MIFTYDSYRGLLNLIKNNGYVFTNYFDYAEIKDPCCILRHDIDNSIEKAYAMYEIEKELGGGVGSTYFVLVASDFYNPASSRNKRLLQMIADTEGFEIGLHFDEAAYAKLPINERKNYAEKERVTLENIIERPIRTVSMHRPAKETLDADWQFDNMVNSYSNEFFHNFKYLSDSRRRWGEPVEEIVTGKSFPRLHILTHAFWYFEEEKTLHDTLKDYIEEARFDRYSYLRGNFMELDSVIKATELESGEIYE